MRLRQRSDHSTKSKLQTEIIRNVKCCPINNTKAAYPYEDDLSCQEEEIGLIVACVNPDLFPQ